MKKILIYTFLFFNWPLFSQENVVLEGIIEADSIASTSINIVNLTQERGTTNSLDGNFNILVKENDTLLFSSVQFEVLRIKINSEIYKAKFLRVKLKKAVNELDEVVISNISLTGNLNTDLANLEVFNQADVGFPLKDYKKPSELDKLYGSLSSSPLSLLINTFNGKIERYKRARKIIKFDQLVNKGIKAVPTSFFTTDLGVPKEEILSFVTYCAQNENFNTIVSEGSTLELIDFYYRKAPIFLINSHNKQ